MRLGKQWLIGGITFCFFWSTASFLNPIVDQAEAKYRKEEFFKKRPVHKVVNGNHAMLKESLEILEDNQETIKDWLKKIEEQLPVGISPCGLHTEEQRFVVSEDETEVCDNLTGLNWEKMPDSIFRNHADALSHCSALDLNNNRTYRLPKVKELISLVDYSMVKPIVLPAGHPFSNVQPSVYWSATANSNYVEQAWFVNFNDGHVISQDKVIPYLAWCVRNGS